MINAGVKSKQRSVFRDAWRRAGILMVFLAAWGQAVPGAVADQKKPADSFQSILIMPTINMSGIYGRNVGIQGPLSGQVFETDVVVPKATEFIDAVLWKRLMQMRSVELIEPNPHVIDSRVGLMPAQGPRYERIAAVQKAGRRMGADDILCTYLYAFRKRVGSAYSVDVPAMVSFESVLVSAASGRIVWQKSFSETQQPLNENLFRIGKFLQRKGRWITAEEMASHAIDEMMESFSELLQKK